MRAGPDDSTHDAPTRLTPGPARGETLPGSPGPGGAGDSLRAGERLEDRYLVEGVLGRGGMGVVLGARDLAAGRRVAIKLVLGATPARVERFRREGRIMASLRHPGLLTVHSAGVSDAGPYLVVDLVEGARALDEAWVGAPLAQRVGWVRDAARALGAAHARGVVHRDVKPSNLLIDADGRVRVADFGLAVADDVTRLTETGALVGTPEFMAPEQVREHAGGVGPAADVWALGVVLFEALTGGRPFQGDGVVEVLAAVCRADVPAPSSRAARVPAALDAVCLRCLRRDPAGRYPDGEALARDLDAWLQGTATHAERARRALRARAAAVAVGLGLALALGLLVVRGGSAAPAEDPVALSAEVDALLAAPRLLADDAAAIEALVARGARLPAAGRKDDAAVAARARVAALLGLLRLAQGDLAAAGDAAAASAGAAPDDAASVALRGALAAVTTAGDPTRARIELTRAIQAGAARPDLRAWRARARGRGGVATTADADAVLADLAAAGTAAHDDDDLRARALLRRGDVAAAWSAVVAGGAPDLRWAIGVRRAQAAYEADAPAAAVAALEAAGPPPPGDPTPDARALRARALSRLERAMGDLEGERLDAAGVAEVLALVRVAHLVAPATPLPDTVIRPLLDHATSVRRRSDEFAAAEVVAEVAAGDPVVQRAVALFSDRLVEERRARFVPVVRRALAGCGDDATLRDTLEVHLCRLLAWSDPPSSLSLATALLARLDDPVARGAVLFARGEARIGLGQLEAALADLDAALALDLADSATIVLRRGCVLTLLGRHQEALAAAARFLATAHTEAGDRALSAARLAWDAGRAAPDLAGARGVVATYVAGAPARGGWRVRLAWLEHALGEGAAAGTTLRGAVGALGADARAEVRALAPAAEAAAGALEAGAPDAAERLGALLAALEALRGGEDLP